MAKQKQHRNYDASDRLFDAFYDLVDSGHNNIKINKNGSKCIYDWTIQILDFRGKILAESKTANEKWREESE